MLRTLSRGVTRAVADNPHMGLHQWETDKALLKAVREHGGVLSDAAAALGYHANTLRNRLRSQGLMQEVQKIRAEARKENRVAPVKPVGTVEEVETDALADAVHLRLKNGKPYQPVDLADELDVSPKRINKAIANLRERGFRIADPSKSPTSEIKLDRLAVESRAVHKALLEGDDITLGIISDTHLNSKECALPQLELAYDVLAERVTPDADGVRHVYHAGDLVAGLGIYRTQAQDLVNHTFESQVDFAVNKYPMREGVKTVLISGNHDVEGDFGRMGADPAAAVCHQREDMSYLGAYTANVELPNGAHMTLVHGRGGGGYAMSYKPQKWVESVPAGRKPALVVFGHWHISGYFKHRNIPLLLGGCFEWQTSLLVRLGLQPDVGFWLVTLRLGDDGSMVKITPEWHQFYEGRHVAVSKPA